MVETIIHLLSGLVGASIPAYLIGRMAWSTTDELTVAIFLGAMASAICIFAGTRTLERIRMGLRYNWKARTLGTWLEIVDHPTGRRYAISEIIRENEGETFKITGWTYEGDHFEIEEQWHSVCLGFPSIGGIYYIYGYDLHRGKPGNDRKGVAYMTFTPTFRSASLYDAGHGYYEDHGQDAVHYRFQRIDESLFQKVLGRKSTKLSTEVRREFLREFASKNRVQQLPILANNSGTVVTFSSTTQQSANSNGR